MITRWGPNKVLEGIDGEEKQYKNKVKCSRSKGINDKEIVDIIKWCADNDHDITIIEVMPMGDIGMKKNYQFTIIRIMKIYQNFCNVELDYKHLALQDILRFLKQGKELVITPLTHNFCESCNRVRLTCTGKLCYCLGQDDNANLAYALEMCKKIKGNNF